MKCIFWLFKNLLKMSDFLKEFLKENLMDWSKFWIELSLRILGLWYSETVRLKGLDAYYPMFEISCDAEYSTCKYHTIYVGNALLNFFGPKIAFLRYILDSISYISGLNTFEHYKQYLIIRLKLLNHI